jgi:DNA-binding transcriptional ArsR family regulator
MSEESFLLVSLNDEKSKKLAQVISNNTSRKILEFLAKKSHTETEISKKLNLPMSTVHYNLKALEEAKLVTVDEFHYSKKGKEVNHYSLTNKYVIIAPQTDGDKNIGLLSKLSNLLPAVIISLLASLGLFINTKSANQTMQSTVNEGIESLSRTTKSAHHEAGILADSAFAEPAAGMYAAATDNASAIPTNAILETMSSQALPPESHSFFHSLLNTEYAYFWFILGAVFFMIMFIITLVVKKHFKCTSKE